MNAYYKGRPEVLALVPSDARVIVDVGCGTGILGQALKASAASRVVYGIEPSASAAEQARTVLDDVLVGFAEDAWPQAWQPPDCIVFADTLEHMVDPWGVLAACAKRLSPNGSVVLSIPNVAHHTAVAPLMLRGQWDYADQGILDRTHLRFFVRRTVFELVAAANLEVDVIKRQWAWPGGFPGTLLRIACVVQRYAEQGSGLRPSGRSMLDHATLQYLVRARPNGTQKSTRV
jgi:trans-aconitate methyltransferase